MQRQGTRCTYREVSRGLQQKENEVVLKPHHVRRASVMHLKVMRGVGEGRGGLARKISPTVSRKDSGVLAAKKGITEERERTEPSLKEQRVSEEKKVSWEADLEEECPSSARSSSSSN